MKKSLRFMAGVCAAAALTASAFAGGRNQMTEEPAGGGAPGQAEFSKDRQTPPLLYALPALDSNDVEVLEIRIMQGSHRLVRETVAVPMGVAAGSVIDVLYSHPQELKKYRELEAATPGALRFIVTTSGRVLTDEPFAAIEAKSAALSVDNAVGEIRLIEVNGPPKSRVQANGVIKEPYCQERCDQELYSCLNDWCDPRGDSCSLCYIWYNDCVMMCPDVCTDPRSVTTYNTATPVAVVGYYGSSCRTNLGVKSLWENITVRYRIDTYERSENCDGSYSDRWISSYDQYHTCWNNTHYYCSYSVGTPPFPRC